MKTIVVDDSLVAGNVTRELIVSMGHEAKLVVCKTLDDCVNLLSLIEAKQPDLVVIDQNMPAMTGNDIAILLRENPSTSGIRTLMVSGDESAISMLEAERAGIKNYSTKPLKKEHIESLLSEGH